MPVPQVYPLSTDRMTGNATSVAAGQVVGIPAPWYGRITKVGVTIGSTATATANATVTVGINGGADITGGTLIIPTGTVNATISVLPTTTTFVNEDDVMTFAFTGTGTAGGNPTCFAVVRGGF